MHTLTQPPDKTMPAHRPPLPPPHWAVIDAWLAQHWPRPL